MYRWIVRRKVLATWRRIDAGDLEAAVGLAVDDVEFEFVGDTELGARLTTRDAFRAWFTETARRLPGLRFEVLDVAVQGWPWRTRVATRLRVSSAQLPTGPYENTMAQWITLRWGRMTHDWVMEDTIALSRALASSVETGQTLRR
ncbi:MAG: hypothetical protein JWM34_212 [Ilumatobacteraceae bacterium]|nr:hypothetical protein [Ilumatobacteraceae bacterium]